MIFRVLRPGLRMTALLKTRTTAKATANAGSLHCVQNDGVVGSESGGCGDAAYGKAYLWAKARFLGWTMRPEAEASGYLIFAGTTMGTVVCRERGKGKGHWVWWWKRAGRAWVGR